MPARFVPNPEGFRRLLQDESGPVMQDLLRRGRNVANVAASLAIQDTGELAASIDVQITNDGGTNAVAVGSSVSYAKFVHDGTGPQHVRGDGGTGSISDPQPNYFPPYSNGLGISGWAQAHGLDPYSLARHIYFSGTPANPFLREALRQAAG